MQGLASAFLILAREQTQCDHEVPGKGTGLCEAVLTGEPSTASGMTWLETGTREATLHQAAVVSAPQSDCRQLELSSTLAHSWRREWLPTPVFLPGEFHRATVQGVAKSHT